MPDAYAWSVQYRDGSRHAQIDEAGEDVNGWASVEAGRVALILIEPRAEHLPQHGVIVPEGASAFYTVRRTQEINPNTGEQIAHPGLVIAGWDGPDGSAYCFVDQFGNALVASSRGAI